MKIGMNEHDDAEDTLSYGWTSAIKKKHLKNLERRILDFFDFPTRHFFDAN